MSVLFKMNCLRNISKVRLKKSCVKSKKIGTGYENYMYELFKYAMNMCIGLCNVYIGHVFDLI